ncbi:MAG: alcohol dehydrogenase catalytic domain-containing protein [Acidimicrobiales bacterium]
MSADQSWTFEQFWEGTTPLPEPNLGWNTYGKGIELVGVDGRPEPIAVEDVGADQLLVRVDAVGLCFSDVKLIRLGGEHPKLYGRDLSEEPTRLGHETSVTVIAVGDELDSQYSAGDRLAIQPDIHVDGRSTAYGYTIPGGLIQYHLLGPEVLDADDGAYVIPIDDDLGYASAALSEPWACVEAAYTQRRRLTPLEGGTIWIHGRPADERSYDFEGTLTNPGKVLLTNVSDAVAAQVSEAVPAGTEIERSTLDGPETFAELAKRHTGDTGFDDIVLLDPRLAAEVAAAARLIAFRGTMALVGETELDGLADIDFGRLHYDYTAYVGTRGPRIADAYGEDRNRCDLRPGGVAAFVGAAGPMGQMHIQRALESEVGPRAIVAIDPDQDRMGTLLEKLKPIAERTGRKLIPVDPNGARSAREVIDELTDGHGADDVVVSVPVAPVMADAGTLMASDGMLVFFAGIANGTEGPLDMSLVYLDNAQYTGTSGSSISDQAAVIAKAKAGSLTPALNLAAIGGIEAGRDGIQAVLEGRFAGKVVIFPQVSGVPLTGLDELGQQLPEVAAALGDQGEWTIAAERVLIEKYGAAERSSNGSHSDNSHSNNTAASGS